MVNTNTTRARAYYAISWRLQNVSRFYFHGKFDMPCGLLFLQAPVLWLSGQPGPPDDSLRVPRDGGLVAPVGKPPGASFAGAGWGSIWHADFGSFRPSAIKLPTTTCKEREAQYCQHSHVKFSNRNEMVGNVGKQKPIAALGLTFYITLLIHSHLWFQSGERDRDRELADKRLREAVGITPPTKMPTWQLTWW